MCTDASSQAIELINSKWLPGLNLDAEEKITGLWQFESIFLEPYRNVPLEMDYVGDTWLIGPFSVFGLLLY